MPFNRDIHHRRSIRLRDHDYARAGAYFVTICTFRKECLFGEVAGGVMQLNIVGLAVAECWQAISDHFPHVELDEFVIMPNHAHGIIVLNDDGNRVGARHASPDFGALGVRTGVAQTRATHASPLQGPGPKSRSIGAIMGSFKSAATKRINEMRANPGGPVWQRNYYEHVIRNEDDLNQIRHYIAVNPCRWDEDENHPSRLW